VSSGRASRRVAAFAMGHESHFTFLEPVVGGLVARGAEVHVFTHRRWAERVARIGARFVDLYAGGELEQADDRSEPLPVRYVTFAGRFAEPLAAEVAALGARLVVYETHSVIARVVARRLALPYVNVGVAHRGGAAARLRPEREYARCEISPACRSAVERLREHHGLADASPFCYAEGVSPWLNLYPEPAELLTAPERRALGPTAYFGCLPAAEAIAARGVDAAEAGGAVTRLYAAFGTVVWRLWRAEALAAMRAIADAVAPLPGVRARLALGGAELDDDETAALRRPNVTVEPWADQWRELERADVAVIHHGVRSTHEAIFHRVPMISCPFFWDQPALAARCAELGLAVPLAGAPRRQPTAAAFREALAAVATRRAALRERLEHARGWELQALAGRDAALARVLALAPPASVNEARPRSPR